MLTALIIGCCRNCAQACAKYCFIILTAYFQVICIYSSYASFGNIGTSGGSAQSDIAHTTHFGGQIVAGYMNIGAAYSALGNFQLVARQVGDIHFTHTFYLE